jgi:hypothetical protein
VYHSRLKRAGMVVFGVFCLVGTAGLVLGDGTLLQAIATGAFGVACIVMGAVPGQRRGSREGVERSDRRLVFQGSYVELTPEGLAWSGASGRFFAPWDAIADAYRMETSGVEELYIELRDPSRLQGSGIVKALSGISRRFFGAEVAVPLSQLTAHPDEFEAAVQRMIAGQSFDALSKSSEHELMQ